MTIKNIDITTLKESLGAMNTGFRRMAKLKAFPAIGWLRSTEVTRGRDGSSHPHFHCLLLVPSSYFGNKYIKQSEWVEMWRNSMRLDYNPILDVQAVKNGSTPMEIIPELLIFFHPIMLYSFNIFRSLLLILHFYFSIVQIKS